MRVVASSTVEPTAWTRRDFAGRAVVPGWEVQSARLLVRHPLVLLSSPWDASSVLVDRDTTVAYREFHPNGGLFTDAACYRGRWRF